MFQSVFKVGFELVHKYWYLQKMSWGLGVRHRRRLEWVDNVKLPLRPQKRTVLFVCISNLKYYKPSWLCNLE